MALSRLESFLISLEF